MTIPIDRHACRLRAALGGAASRSGRRTAPFEGDARTIDADRGRGAADSRGGCARAGRRAHSAGRSAPASPASAVLPVAAVATARARRETMLSSGPLRDGLGRRREADDVSPHRAGRARTAAGRARAAPDRPTPTPLPGAADPDVAGRRAPASAPGARSAAGGAPGAHLRLAGRGGARRAARPTPLGDRAGLEVEAQVSTRASASGRYARRTSSVAERRSRLTGRDSPTRSARRGASPAGAARDSRDPRDRPGDDRHDVPRRRRRAAARAAAATASSSSTTRSRAGSSTIPRSSGERARARPRRRVRRRRDRVRRSSRRSGSRTSARRRSSGSERSGRPVAPRDRLAGPAHRRALPRRCPPSCCGRGQASSPTPTSPRPSSNGCSRARTCRAGELAFGTVDSWLVWKLTGGRVHATDVTNASRTMLLDLDDPRLGCRAARAVRRRSGAAARGSSAPRSVVGEAELLGVDAPDRGHRGRPAGGALRARLLRAAAQAKATYGTGSFVLANAGAERGPAPDGAARRRRLPSGGYALEGAILASGAAIQWLRDGLGVLATPPRASRWQPRSSRRAASTSCRPSPGWARRTGTPEARGLDQRHHARHDAGATRARRARGDRLPGRGRPRSAARAASTCCAPTAARARTAS